MKNPFYERRERGRFHINPFLLPVILFALWCGFFRQYLMMFFLMLCHELAHLVALWKREIKIHSISVEPFGINIRLQNELIQNPDDEIIMALAGPLCNLGLALAFLLFRSVSGIWNQELSFLYYANISCALVNLLPAVPLDGGRVLRAFLSKFIGYIKAYYFCEKLTKILSLLLIVCGIWLFFATRFNFSVCLIGCFLYGNLFMEKNNLRLYLMREIADYKKRQKVIESMPISSIAVNKDLSARKILNHFCHNRYYLITVLDGIQIMGTLTEGELIDGIIRKGSNVKMKELVMKHRAQHSIAEHDKIFLSKRKG
jgi:peptidase M50